MLFIAVATAWELNNFWGTFHARILAFKFPNQLKNIIKDTVSQDFLMEDYFSVAKVKLI
jgi:hypothetical protein